MTTPDTLELRNRIQAAHDHGMPNALVPVEVAQALLDRVEAAEGREAWQPIETYSGCGPALVSTAPDSPKYLFSEPVSAFRDVTGVWRCLGSEGGSAALARQPTHWRPLPEAPTPPKEKSQ